MKSEELFNKKDIAVLAFGALLLLLQFLAGLQTGACRALAGRKSAAP